MNKSRAKGKVYLYPLVSVNMTDRDVIERVGKIFGAAVQAAPSNHGRRVDGRRGKQSYRVSLQGSRAVILMQAILPHMGHRRSKTIRKLLAQHAQKGNPNDRRKQWAIKAAAKRERDAMGRLT